LFIVAGIDILVHEQLTFIERVKSELKELGDGNRNFEAIVFDRGFHGWLGRQLSLFDIFWKVNLTAVIVPLKAFDNDRVKAYGAAIKLIQNAQSHGDQGVNDRSTFV
jgi:hypothetical protein